MNDFVFIRKCFMLKIKSPVFNMNIDTFEVLLRMSRDFEAIIIMGFDLAHRRF